MYNTYPQHQNYGPQHNGYGYAPMQQPMPMQQMPVAAPVAASSSNTGLLMIAGIAVVGAAAFGGVDLMNSSHDAAPAAASAPSTTISIPSEINIPGLTTDTNSDPASPVIVNNPAPIRVVTPSAPRSNTTSTVPAQRQAPAVASAPAPAPAPAPATTGTTGTTGTPATTGTTTTTDDAKKAAEDAAAKKAAEDAAAKKAAEDAAAKKAAEDAAAKKAAEDAAAKKAAEDAAAKKAADDAAAKAAEQKQLDDLNKQFQEQQKQAGEVFSNFPGL
jgi:type IV secretory pathway VirB10-like protein